MQKWSYSGRFTYILTVYSQHLSVFVMVAALNIFKNNVAVMDLRTTFPSSGTDSVFKFIFGALNTTEYIYI